TGKAQRATSTSALIAASAFVASRRTMLASILACGAHVTQHMVRIPLSGVVSRDLQRNFHGLWRPIVVRCGCHRPWGGNHERRATLVRAQPPRVGTAAYSGDLDRLFRPNVTGHSAGS